MTAVTLSATPNQLAAYGADFDALVDSLRAQGLDANVEPRAAVRGPVSDVLLYVGDHALSVATELVLLEALRRLRRAAQNDPPPPRRFVLVNEDGDTITTVELPADE